MTRCIKTLLGAAVVGGSLLMGVTGVPAQAADVTVGVGHGGIAFGYQDGYWDRTRNWHAWQNAQEHERYREANRDHYYAWHHERDGDKGWRDHDRYWERR